MIGPAPALPATLAPPAPFALVVSQSHETEFVAPGVRRAIYHLTTSDGPLVITAVAVDPRERTVRFGTVVANDRLVSAGETVSSMAARTQAVAGINADYFDIGATNQPLNLVVRDGALVRTPSKRVVLDVRTDRSVRFENVSFAGSVRYGDTVLPLTSVNEWPPEGGVSLMTPAFGPIKDVPGVSVAAIVPANSTDPAPANSTDSAPGFPGSYTVASVAAAPGLPVIGNVLGFGPAARALGPLPNVGDRIELSATTAPPLDEIACAVGGGPLLVANGAFADDPNAPAPEERDRRFPVSGAATTANGEVVLVAVDGRRQSLSIGLTRPQFAALMLGFGATDAMAFDSGGSATLVARVLGDSRASVLNSPSDGEERAVADGLFVYSDAPQEAPSLLVVRPAHIFALPNTGVPVKLGLVDAAGHAVPPRDEPPPQIVPGSAFSRIATVRAHSLAARVPVDIVPQLARLDIAPEDRDPQPGATVRFRATGSDANGDIVSLGDRVRWTTDRGRFAGPGILVAPARDARVTAAVAGARAVWSLRIGHHRESLALFTASGSPAWQFATAPAGSNGGVTVAGEPAELSLAYDFTNGARAAYANADVALPGEPRIFTVEINGDRSGLTVRAAFLNSFGERRALTLASAVDWEGWREANVMLPDDLNPPVRLLSLYVVAPPSSAGARTLAGTIVFRNPSLVVAGTP